MPDLLVPGAFGTEARSDRVNAMMRDKNNMSRRPLTPFERNILDEGELNPIYIYNVSPIHEWSRPQGQLGTIVIPKRAWDQTVSIPRVIKGAIVRWVPKGLTIEPFIEGGAEIAEDVCGCGQTADGRHASANLTRYGVFISPKPFDMEYLPPPKKMQVTKANKTAAEELLREYLVPKHEQKHMIEEATGKLLGELQNRILEADNWYNGGPEQRKFVGPWHRENLRAFNEITGRKEARPWSTITMGDTLVACEFCGNMNKPGLAKCPNCKEILNLAAYNKLKAEIGN